MQALRRTLRDLFTFVPFTVILIIPLTPLGHVLVFGFIQRYFPDFFPSQFNARRQAMAKRYQGLKDELSQAQAAADHEEVCCLALPFTKTCPACTVRRGVPGAGGGRSRGGVLSPLAVVFSVVWSCLRHRRRSTTRRCAAAPCCAV